MNDLYPLKFHPIPKEKIWGGEKLDKFLNKNFGFKNIGESWEISDVEGNSSVVSNGKFKGQELRKLVQTHKTALVGKKVYEDFGDTFPLLIKFIDARENLSVQLHPDDELAKKRHGSFGKTEMWYIMQADEGSGLILGFKEKVQRQTYLQHLEQKKLLQILNFEKVKKGDVFFIKPGLVHAIGGGVLLAEIQQTSDITYRVYDWDRKDLNGKERELHTELSLDAIDFEIGKNTKVNYEEKGNSPIPLVKNPYFKTNLISLSGKMDMDYNHRDSFTIFMALEGKAQISIPGMAAEFLEMGETLLIPACFEKVSLHAEKGKLLEICI